LSSFSFKFSSLFHTFFYKSSAPPPPLLGGGLSQPRLFLSSILMRSKIGLRELYGSSCSVGVLQASNLAKLEEQYIWRSDIPMDRQGESLQVSYHHLAPPKHPCPAHREGYLYL
jgi:hypothetical protein